MPSSSRRIKDLIYVHKFLLRVFEDSYEKDILNVVEMYILLFQ